MFNLLTEDKDISIAFYIGNLPIRWYGIFITIGFILAIALAIVKLTAWYKIKSDPFYFFCLIGIPTALLGARLWSCVIGDATWSHFFKVGEGGLAIEGGVILTFIVALIYFPLVLKKPQYMVRDLLTTPEKPQVRQVSMWVYFDAIVPCILIGQVLGRWGNYFNQELYGAATTNQSLINFMEKVIPYMNIEGTWYQPLFLYESCINFVGLIFIYVAMEYMKGIKAGTIGTTYVLWYGVVRMCLEPLRDQQFTFVLSYVMTALWIVCALTIIILNQTGIIPKTRKYHCMLFVWDKTFGQLNRNIQKGKLERAENNLNAALNDPKCSDDDKQVLLNKVNFLKEKNAALESKHLIRKSNYIRTPDKIMYYNGR